MIKKRKKSQENFVWLSYSDLATGLMISFILVFMESHRKIVEPVKHSREAFNNVNEQVIKLIKREKNCKGAKISSRIDHPETIQIQYESRKGKSWFKNGRFKLEGHAKRCLSRFGKIWLREMYKENEKRSVKIRSLIVEGHTNSHRRQRGMSEEENFISNLELSQQRAFETIKYILKTTSARKIRLPKKFDKWKRKKLSAHGRSYSDKIFKNKREDFSNSKRVEFKYTL